MCFDFWSISQFTAFLVDSLLLEECPKLSKQNTRGWLAVDNKLEGVCEHSCIHWLDLRHTVYFLSKSNVPEKKHFWKNPTRINTNQELPIFVEISATFSLDQPAIVRPDPLKKVKDEHHLHQFQTLPFALIIKTLSLRLGFKIISLWLPRSPVFHRNNKVSGER